VSHHLPDLERFARHLARGDADAEDLVQETCRRSLEASALFVDGTDLRAWLFRILRNLHYDRRRRSGREIPIGDRDDELASPEPVERSAWRDVSDSDLALALDSLSPDYRRPYVLFTVDGLSYAEVAEKLQIAPSTVGTRLLRARARLRKFLTQRCDCPATGA
jgi:RNA polymerase sigma-70 factor (ECF subfamily)